MAGLPRRLGHAEEATLGEHLEELRGRLFVMLGAIALGTVVAYVFHNDVLNWLNRPLPANHRKLADVRRRRAVHGRRSPSASTPASCSRCRSCSGRSGSSSRPRSTPLRSGRCSVSRSSRSCSARPGSPSATGSCCPARCTSSRTTTRALPDLIRASSYYSFVVTVLVGIVLVFQTPLVDSRARRPRRPQLADAAPSPDAWATSSPRRSRSRCPGPDPVTTFLELLPMWLLFEASIWLAVIYERRRAKPAPASATLGG